MFLFNDFKYQTIFKGEVIANLTLDWIFFRSEQRWVNA
jgi:hypothetical protein